MRPVPSSRPLGRREDIPVIFLSAKGQESEIKQGLSAGATQYILKPFAPDDLVRQVAVGAQENWASRTRRAGVLRDESRLRQWQ